MQRSTPMRTDSTVVGLDEVEENFRRDLAAECAYINEPELDGIAKEMKKVNAHDTSSFVSPKRWRCLFDVFVAHFLL